MLILIGSVCLVVATLASLARPSASFWLDALAFVPAEISQIIAQPLGQWLQRPMLHLISALFVHVDWLHLVGNLAYLWVFGLTVERAVGHLRFGLLFVLLGALANLVVAWQLGDSTRPVVGASGGVSAIIGVYLGLFPDRRMGLWLPLGLYLQFARVPALLVIGSWFALQLLFSVFGPMSGDVAWWSHVAGFLFGLIAALFLRLIPGQANLRLRDD
ncbi:rhomboid family intramembrane serine protease [Wenzhouxiangella marina]|uniref:Membrane protein n=1 Tax=Wenzhouxiangella marina TaxID=1579979 RepID=A0A0K0XW82_9GAMM|nr:rhomboid family intramembrane serine protease [Wenzhouxiangella marina]AKS41964.1 membrane protein [Wenzhouxiangella marina]MBB6086269.1 membrane associated rhomboid family serine protease [Wenzhouxiangella marina]